MPFSIFLSHSSMKLNITKEGLIFLKRLQREFQNHGLLLLEKLTWMLLDMILSEIAMFSAIETALESRNMFLLIPYYSVQDIDAIVGID